MRDLRSLVFWLAVEVVTVCAALVVTGTVMVLATTEWIVLTTDLGDGPWPVRATIVLRATDWGQNGGMVGRLIGTGIAIAVRVMLHLPLEP